MIPGPLKTSAKLILASGSPRRKSLLQNLGLEFDVIVAKIEEIPLSGETPVEFVRRAAREKSVEVSRQHASFWVLGADTVVVSGERILGKPADEAEALRILHELAGQKHVVHTGFCLMNGAEDVSVCRVVTTEVRFSAFSDAIAAAYVATGEPLDKAGAYGIQGRGGVLVESINGSYSNVVGLPLAEVVEELLRYKAIEARTE